MAKHKKKQIYKSALLHEFSDQTILDKWADCWGFDIPYSVDAFIDNLEVNRVSKTELKEIWEYTKGLIESHTPRTRIEPAISALMYEIQEGNSKQINKILGFDDTDDKENIINWLSRTDCTTEKVLPVLKKLGYKIA